MSNIRYSIPRRQTGRSRWATGPRTNCCRRASATGNRRLLPFGHKRERAFADALGCDWMTNREGRQAVPPAYTEFIGKQLWEHLAHAKGTRDNAMQGARL